MFNHTKGFKCQACPSCGHNFRVIDNSKKCHSCSEIEDKDSRGDAVFTAKRRAFEDMLEAKRYKFMVEL